MAISAQDLSDSALESRARRRAIDDCNRLLELLILHHPERCPSRIIKTATARPANKSPAPTINGKPSKGKMFDDNNYMRFGFR